MNVENSIVELSLKRGPIRGPKNKAVGLVVDIKAKPSLELYMKEWSGGRTIGVDAFADMWHNMNADQDRPLEVYALPQMFPSREYNMNGVGLPLFSPNEAPRRNGAPEEYGPINLAFLTLVGISSPEGVTIGISGAYSKDYINKLRNELPRALRQFLYEYIVPMTINLHIIEK